MTADLSRTHWTDAARARHFIIPDDAVLAAGDLALRTATGRERSVDESAVAPFEVAEEEAHAWAKEQLGAVFGELRGQTLGFVEQLRQKTAEMRAENRRTWEQAVADAPPEVREAGAHLRDMLKDLGATLRKAARDHGYTPDADQAPSGGTPSSAASSTRTGDRDSASAGIASPGNASVDTASAGVAADRTEPSAATNPPSASPPSASANPSANDAEAPPAARTAAGP
jgi:hypothetical protein